MSVPAYYRSRQGRVFRLQRVRAEKPDGSARYILRAIPISASSNGRNSEPLEVVHETDMAEVRDRIQHRHQIATSEQTFDQLWQRLRMDLEGA